MKLDYLQTAQPGARWFRGYYRRNPQLDIAKAVAALKAAEQTLIAHPMAGERLDGLADVRELKIIGTAFSLLYTVRLETVYVIDIRDQRGLRSADALRQFTRELRQRMGQG